MLVKGAPGNCRETFGRAADVVYLKVSAEQNGNHGHNESHIDFKKISLEFKINRWMLDWRVCVHHGEDPSKDAQISSQFSPAQRSCLTVVSDTYTWLCLMFLLFVTMF